MKKKIITGFTLIALIAMNSISTFAVSNQQIFLKENQVWTSCSTSRTGDFSYAQAGCDSVYPVDGADNFTKIQTRITNPSGTVISQKAYTVLTEGQGSSRIYIKDGALSFRTINIQFRGNSASSAYAVVDYSGL